MRLGLEAVSARDLHQRTVALHRGELPMGELVKASLFPYFDAVGMVHSVMVVWPASPWISFLEPERVEIGGFGAIRIEADLMDLHDVEPAELEPLAELWHVDPWWVLGEDRFYGHSAVPVLKATNAVAVSKHFGEEFLFAPDLSRVDGKLPPLPKPAALAAPASHAHSPGSTSGSRANRDPGQLFGRQGLAWKLRTDWPGSSWSSPRFGRAK